MYIFTIIATIKTNASGINLEGIYIWQLFSLYNVQVQRDKQKNKRNLHLMLMQEAYVFLEDIK